MTAILGISAFYHDSAAALVVDGEIIAAAQEERFTRIKHDSAFPINALTYCLEEGGLEPEEIDWVVFYEKPYLKFERLLETYLNFAPIGLKSFFKALPIWLNQKLHLPKEMSRSMGDRYKKKYLFPEHHESHAASAFFPSPFDEAAVLTMDGVGEWATSSIGKGSGNKIKLLHELHFPHSLGLLYSAFTYYCGFRVNSGEYKLMGLAPYGDPEYADLILEKLIDLKPDGSFKMNMEYFNYGAGLTMTSSKFHQLFGEEPRKPETEITQKHMNLAASVQAVTEKIMISMARFAYQESGECKNLCLAGGVALNCVGNGKLLSETEFDNIWIQPAAGDAGGALGAALFTWYQLLDNQRHVETTDAQKASKLGPAYPEKWIEKFVSENSIKAHSFEGSVEAETARLISEGNVVGWFQGRSEFGPRALGSRSIIGDPRDPEMQKRMNLKIKFRESFRPFAPVVLEEAAHDIFSLDAKDSPYMLLVGDVQEKHRKDIDESATGFDRLKQIRSIYPAITHVDFSARIQTVDQKRDKRFWNLLKEFERLTECPVLINTSYNVRGEPIVCSPEDAWNCFMNTDMDVLVLGETILLKKDQPNKKKQENSEYLGKFTLD